MTFVQDLAAELATVRVDDLSSRTVENAKMTVASSIAAGMVGHRSPPVDLIRRLVSSRGCVAEAGLWFTGLRAHVVDAARINHMAADESMADDSALMNGAHLGSAVTAAALAMAETTGSSGRDVLCAIVTGYEAAIRIGRAEAELRAQRHGHVSGLNAFAAAATAAKILAADPEEFAHALVLATTVAGGVDRVSTNAARPYQAGVFVGQGLEAALAAHDGYRAETSVMDRYLDLIGMDGTPTGRLVPVAAGDGDWALDTELIVKVRPGAFLYGSAVEAAVRVVRDHDLDVDEVEAVTVRGHAFLVEDETDRPPHTGSLSWYVAAAMVRRRFDWAAFDDAGDADRIDRLRRRVHISPTSKDDAPGRWPWAAEVIVTRPGGEVRTAVDLPPGALASGLSWADVEGKVRDLSGRCGLGGLGDTVMDEVRGLDSAPTIAALTEVLGTSAGDVRR